MISKGIVCKLFYFQKIATNLSAHNSVLLLFVQLNDFKYCYLTLKILFDINPLFTQWGGLQIIIFYTINSKYCFKKWVLGIKNVLKS